jgi:hypothetical protein
MVALSQLLTELTESVLQHSLHVRLREPVRACEIRSRPPSEKHFFHQLSGGWWTSNHLIYGARGILAWLGQSPVPDRPQQPGLGRSQLGVVTPQQGKGFFQRPCRRIAVIGDPQRDREELGRVPVVEGGEFHEGRRMKDEG